MTQMNREWLWLKSPASINIRPATQDDARFIVPLIAESSGGVWTAIWNSQSSPGVAVNSVAESYLTNTQNELSIVNTVIAESAGDRVGLMVAYQEPPIELTEDASAKHSDNGDSLDAALRPYRELRDSESWFISEICLLPASRGKGIGTQLLNHARESAIRAGFTRLTLRVFSENVGAIKLYQRFGFTITGRRDVVSYPGISISGEVFRMECLLNS